MHQILAIDDTTNIHALIDGILAPEPVTLHHAYDGSQGLTLAESIRPDLILLDVEMPGIDGYETCRRLKANSKLFSCPVVFLTALSSTDEKVKGLELGAVDYITKPFSPPELLARVRATLRTSRAIKMLEEHSLIDFLTGLGNRSLFKQRLAAEVSLRVRTKKALACIVVDVENFQTINDAQGHPFADHVLQEVAKVLENEIRIEDVACRLEGDVFVVIAPNTETEDATQLADRIDREFKKLQFTNQGKPVDVQCSVAVGPAIDTYDRSMFERAQAAMTEARKTGDQAVVVADRSLEADRIAA